MRQSHKRLLWFGWNIEIDHLDPRKPTFQWVGLVIPTPWRTGIGGKNLAGTWSHGLSCDLECSKAYYNNRVEEYNYAIVVRKAARRRQRELALYIYYPITGMLLNDFLENLLMHPFSWKWLWQSECLLPYLQNIYQRRTKFSGESKLR